MRCPCKMLACLAGTRKSCLPTKAAAFIFALHRTPTRGCPGLVCCVGTVNLFRKHTARHVAVLTAVLCLGGATMLLIFASKQLQRKRPLSGCRLQTMTLSQVVSPSRRSRRSTVLDPPPERRLLDTADLRLDANDRQDHRTCLRSAAQTPSKRQGKDSGQAGHLAGM